VKLLAYHVTDRLYMINIVTVETGFSLFTFIKNTPECIKKI